MPDVLNSVAHVSPGMQFVCGTVLDTAGVPSLSQLSGDPTSDQAQVSVIDNGAGNYGLVVTNFRGASGYIAGLATSVTISTMASVTAQTYTAGTDTANFTVRIEDDASTATDSSFNFILVAF